MAELHDIVFDCRHPASVARFWAAVLDGYEVAPYDEAELARLRANGIFDVNDDPSVLVERVDGAGPRLIFMLVPEAKTVKNRVHIDVLADDLRAEAARLVELGGQQLADRGDLLVMADIEGNEFCLAPR